MFKKLIFTRGYEMEDVRTIDVHFAPQVPKYRVFEGPRRVDVELAITKDPDGRHTASVTEVLQFRLDALKSDYKPAINQAWNSWYDSSTWVVYNKDQVKVGEGFSMPENPQLKNGTLVLTEKQYEELKGKTFSRKELEKAVLNAWLPGKKVLKHPIWQAVVGDKKILQTYVDAYFKKYNTKTGMGVYLSSSQDKLILRALVFHGGDYWSALNDGRLLDGNDARLVGVRKGLEAKIA